MHYVLTYNPKYRSTSLQELISFIKECSLSVYMSKVSGFGAPVLRIGPGEYVKGVSAITQFLREQQLKKQGK